jgi:hypothetical protein
MERPPTPFDGEWLQWIAEQRLRHCTPQSMLATMVGAGLDPALSARAIADVEASPLFAAARRVQQLHRKLESVVGNLQRLWELDPHYDEVERIAEPAPAHFVERYVRGCRPVVLTGVADDWPALRRWSPADLRQRFGHLDVEVQAARESDPLYEQNKLDHRQIVRLADFVDRVTAGGPTNDCYLTANNELLRRREFAPLLDDIGSLPRICDRGRLAEASSFWFGPAGAVTPLHHDTLMLFHTQVVGRKRWRFVSPLETPRLYNHHDVYSAVDLDRPDLHRHPDFRGVRVLDVVAAPGDTVFLPLGWWHQVSSLDVCLSVSYSNLALPNEYRYDNPDIRNW